MTVDRVYVKRLPDLPTDVDNTCKPTASPEHGRVDPDPDRGLDIRGGLGLGAAAPHPAHEHLKWARLKRVHTSDTREWTRDLLSRVVDADPQERQLIRDEVVRLHLWLADRAARRFGPPSEFDDLVQVARIGLVEAFDRYDPSEATTYPYFAWVTMNGLLRQYLRDHGWSVRPPRSTQEAANVLRKAAPELAQELGRAPSTADLATYLGWTAAAVEKARTAERAHRAASIEALVGDAWVPKHPPEWHLVETRVLLQQATQSLTERERDLLQMRFVDEMTQRQIAAVLGVTQMQVSRLLTRLMARLRTQIGELDEIETGN